MIQQLVEERKRIIKGVLNKEIKVKEVAQLLGVSRETIVNKIVREN